MLKRMLGISIILLSLVACSDSNTEQLYIEATVEPKETKTVKPENSTQATPALKAINVSKSDSTNYSNPTSNDKATITCDVDIPKRTLLCEAYPIPDDSYPKWSSNIGGWSNSKSYKLQLER